jgi:hypothetical protein
MKKFVSYVNIVAYLGMTTKSVAMECGRQMTSSMETRCWHFVEAMPQLWNHASSFCMARAEVVLLGIVDFKDSATSPVKSTPMEEDGEDDDHSGAKKKLELSGMVDVNGDNNISGSEEDKEPEMPPPPLGYVNHQDRSKQRKTITTDNDWQHRHR